MASPLRIAAKLNNPWVLLVCAGILALLMSFAAMSYLQDKEKRLREEIAQKAGNEQTPKIAVVVPPKDVKPGTVISSATFVAREIDADLVYDDMVKASEFNSLTGLKLTQGVQQGRPLRMSDIQPEKVSDVSTIIAPGKRAITIEIDSNNSMAQMLRAGNTVDLYLIANEVQQKKEAIEDGAPSLAAKLFLQDVLVIATGKDFRKTELTQDGGTKAKKPNGVFENEKDDKYDSITLQVTANEAASIALAQKVGSLRAVLRGENDRQALQFTSINARKLLTGRDSLPTPKQEGGVEMILGGKGAAGGKAMQIPQMSDFLKALPMPDMKKPPVPVEGIMVDNVPAAEPAVRPGNSPIPALAKMAGQERK